MFRRWVSSRTGTSSMGLLLFARSLAILAQAISVQGHLLARVGLLLFFRPSRLLWMGRNRKWVLEDSLQDAMWKTILRGPRPPSVRWEKPRNQSAAVTHQPGAKRNKSSSVKTEAKKKDPPQVAPPRRESITLHRLQPASELGNWKQFFQRWRTTTRLLQSSRLL